MSTLRFIALLLLVFSLLSCEQEQQRPNILFCLADDWSFPDASIYGNHSLKTPSFDRIAEEGALFNQAYVTTPSCTPSRYSIVTGKYFWELGSGANLMSELPPEHKSFVHLLADNGYIAGHSKAKTLGPGTLRKWAKANGGHPLKKPYKSFKEFLNYTETKQNPFFFWLGTTDPHRPYKRGSGVRSGINIDSIHLLDQFPNAKLIKSDVADYYWEIQRWDVILGNAIKELEARGLLENTIIIISGDNGMPFPRCKCNLYDCGVRVPMAIRWGNNIKPNLKLNDFVSFADIAPTILDFASVPIPNEMTGKSFKNLLVTSYTKAERNDIVYGRERHNMAQKKPSTEGYPSRALRNEKYLYIHNYRPDLWPVGIEDTTSYVKSFMDYGKGPTKKFLMNNRNKNERFKKSFELCFGKRPEHELYNLEQDPDQIHNLAYIDNYRTTLIEMQSRLQTKLLLLNDPRAKDPNYKVFDQYPYLTPKEEKKLRALNEK